MSNHDEKKTIDERSKEFLAQRDRIYLAIGEVVLPSPNTPKERELEYLYAGVAAQFLALQGSAYAFKMCDLISEDDYKKIDEALKLVTDGFRAAVRAAERANQPADSEPPVLH